MVAGLAAFLWAAPAAAVADPRADAGDTLSTDATPATPAPAEATRTPSLPDAAPTGAFQAMAGPAPSDFVLPVLDGAPTALRAAQGKVVLVHVFATWCEPCREELPALSRLAERHPDTVRVLAIDVGEVDARVRRFFDALPVSFPVLLDRDRAMMRAWGVSALPTTFVLAPDLQLRYRAVGDVAWDAREGDRLIAALASPPAFPPQDPSASPGPAGAVPHAAFAVTGGLPR